MYPFGHQGTSFEGEQYHNTNYYAPSRNGNQNQYDDQYYYDEGYHYESYQHENFDPQEYQVMPQDTAQVRTMEIMLYNFLQQQEKRDQERQARLEKVDQERLDVEIQTKISIDNLQVMVEQLQIQQGLLRDRLEQQAVAATERFMNEEVEMEIASHQEIQVYDAGIYSNLLSVAVGDGLNTSPPSESDLETEHYVESKKESCEDLADVYPCATKEDPLENLNVAVKSECEVWKPSFPTVEYARSSLVGAAYEDVYLTTPPPNKFQQFFPYILELLNERFHDPIILVEAYILKGSRPYFHFILHGRILKWDLKVD